MTQHRVLIPILMPSSRPNTIPVVINLLRELQPQSILDVGVGFGKWGHLFREYTDILESERDPSRYLRENWRVQIDGIEGYPAYLTEMHRYIYNQLYTGNALQIIKKVPSYDLVFLGDIIEHFEKEAGFELLRQAIAHAHKAVIVTTPKYETDQGDLCGNELERHRSLWREKDFNQFTGAVVKTIDRATLLAAIIMPGVTPPTFTPPMPPKAADARRLRQAVDYLTHLIPVEQPFILVDEEQIRSELPHRNALPFLEKGGEYWGPPEDDGTAIAEFERMRESGAAFIGFIWSCFWWLEYYPAFYQHLRDRFSCAIENEEIVIFDLRR
jgi:hypothetical protein